MLEKNAHVDTERDSCFKHQRVLKVQGRSNEGCKMYALQNFQQVVVFSQSLQDLDTSSQQNVVFGIADVKAWCTGCLDSSSSQFTAHSTAITKKICLLDQ